MINIDQHMHCSFSFDSKEDMENYLKLTENSIVTTDHLEFGNPLTGRDDIIDYDEYVKRVKDLKKKYDREILLGVEIGYTNENVDKIKEYLRGKKYDIKLLSVHQNGEYDFLQDNRPDTGNKEAVDMYYSLMIDALESGIEADVLTHFDYGLRNQKITLDEFIEYGKKYVDHILNLVIKKEMAVELNSRSMYRYGKAGFYDYFIDMYIRKGGKLITAGSDAHSVKDYMVCFDEVMKFMKSHGLDRIYRYRDGRPEEEKI